jgi:hypothetical protein
MWLTDMILFRYTFESSLQIYAVTRHIWLESTDTNK